jgi:hypothetical protein
MMQGEISYDLIMEADMAFVEAVFRLPGEPWQVLIISRASVRVPEIVPSEWESGTTGLCVRFPDDRSLNAEAVEAILTIATGISAWRLVRGPDSMDLR